MEIIFETTQLKKDNVCIFLRSFRTMKSHVHRRHIYITACYELKVDKLSQLVPCQDGVGK